ncbi:hypothetical protein B551_0222610 [Cupriavidus sp. HPC(L)]|uniref:hypothetical protein n=1 Tax=Cupriavidus sp. HPC(L) TaxID=1217418 RepID=UPI00029148CE|nr:hypothetical protein [Cupriavidus sp. HPC(L)]ESH90766.1 hypothetical protein B551_0222610 [Cupriavidus sp. HPC(L)]
MNLRHLSEGLVYRLPSGKRTKFARYVAKTATYLFVYEDDGSDIQDRKVPLTERIAALAVPELGQ